MRKQSYRVFVDYRDNHPIILERRNRPGRRRKGRVITVRATDQEEARELARELV